MLIALLHTDSRESLNKALRFREAASGKGYRVLLLYPSLKPETKFDHLGSICYSSSGTAGLPEALLRALKGHEVRLIIPCSDSLTGSAVFVSSRLGLIDATSVEPFLSKSAGYQLFKEAGFSTLAHSTINSLEDIANSTIKGPIFVKPDWSSGVHSISKLGYTAYESTEDFLRAAMQDPLDFERSCKNPHARLMMMEYVPHDGVYCISAALSKDKTFCFGHSYMKISGNDYFYDYVLYEDTGNTCSLEPLISNLWGKGFRSNFIYLQCLLRDGVLYPMDVNTRLSTYLDTLATHYGLGFYTSVLDFLLGDADSVDFAIPDHCLIGRINCCPHTPIKSITYSALEGVDYVNFGKTSPSCAAYDKAYSWPTYVCSGNSSEDALQKHYSVQQNTLVEQ